MAITEDLQRRMGALARQLCEEAGDVDESAGVCWLDAVENQAIEIADAVMAEVVKQRSLDRPAPAEAHCPTCGQRGRCRGLRQRKLITRRGPTTIVEPEHYCPGCRRAFFPADQRVGS
jgi:hypothetical protein